MIGWSLIVVKYGNSLMVSWRMYGCPIRVKEDMKTLIVITLRSKINKGVILDERFNGGGFIADYFVDIIIESSAVTLIM